MFESYYYSTYCLGVIEEEVVGECPLQGEVPSRPLLTQPVVLVKQVFQSLLDVAGTHDKLGRNTECTTQERKSLERTRKYLPIFYYMYSILCPCNVVHGHIVNSNIPLATREL